MYFMGDKAAIQSVAISRDCNVDNKLARVSNRDVFTALCKTTVFISIYVAGDETTRQQVIP